MEMHPDLTDRLGALAASNVDFLVVGGWAVSFHSEPRFTKDLELLVGRDEGNLRRLVDALATFGAPATILAQASALGPDEFLFFGAPPARVDILRSIPGVDDFEAALGRAFHANLGEVQIPVLSLTDLLSAKRAAGRPRDRRDLEILERARARRGGSP